MSFTDIIGALNVLVAAIYAFLTHRIVKTSKEQTQANLRPYVTIYHTLLSESVIILYIKNTGKTNATDLKLRLNKDFFQFGSGSEGDNLANLYVFKNTLPSFAPGSVLEFPLETSIALQSKDPNNAEDYIFTVEATYSFFEKTVTESTAVDLRCYMGVWMPQPTVADNLKELTKQLVNELVEIKDLIRNKFAG